MRIIADYHTHTIYSHGMGTIEENVRVATNKGLETIAITDHGTGFKEGINKCDYREMRDIVDRLNEKYTGIINILLGIEANIMDKQGNLDIDEDILKYSDILLAGFHFDIAYKDFLMEIRTKLNRRQRLKPQLEESLYKEIVEINTDALINSMNTYDIDIITHPSDNQPIDISRISAIAGKTNTALEINNFHRCLNAYQINEAMASENVEFVINSDAHRPRDVGNFLGAIKIFHKSGLDMKRVKNIRL